ncbi:MAG TPA: FAD-dependent monooxygenase [Vicinamibacterales bacterium]|nr:FAD-dependent monooxygenase [Vicinamibacterales bacterium]
MDRGEARVALIVGAGIGGLAAGIALRRGGWGVRVFERAANPRELGFALGLAPNALMALREIGLGDAALRQGARVRTFELRRADGSALKRIRFSEHAAMSVVMLRTTLHGALLDSVGTDALRLGREATGATSSGDGAELEFADGTTVRGDVVIGADGVGSAIRRRLHPEEPSPSPSGYYALRGVAHDAAHNLGDVDTAVYLGDGVEAGLAKASASAVYWYVSLVDEYVEGGRDPRAILRRCTRGLDERFCAVADATSAEDLRLDRLFTRAPIDRWGEGRITLLGDAAHPVLPHTAQGAALALEDAVALGLALGRGQEPSHRLRVYERVRSRRTARTIAIGPRIAAMSTTRSALRIRAREAAIRLLPGSLLSSFLTLHARDPHRRLRP